MRYCQEKGIACQYAGTNMHCRLTACVFPKESLYPAAVGGGHLMDIEKLIDRLGENTDCWTDKVHGYADLRLEAATALSTLQAENARLRAELEQMKRCIEIVENQRDAAIYDMTALMAGQCCDLCAVEHCSDRYKTVMCTAFKWRGPQKED